MHKRVKFTLTRSSDGHAEPGWSLVGAKYSARALTTAAGGIQTLLTQNGRSPVISCETSAPNHIKGSVHQNTKPNAEEHRGKIKRTCFIRLFDVCLL